MLSYSNPEDLMAGNPAVAQHDSDTSTHPNPNISLSAQLSSLNMCFNVHEKLLRYDLASKLHSDSLSHEEVSSLIQESEKESREYDCEIGRLEAEIGRLKSVIVTLRNGQEKLDTLTKRFRTALCPCPIRKLPAELLSEIFRELLGHCSWWGQIEIEPSRLPRIPPLTLAHTCTHWRSIAFDTPSLWSRIEITLRMFRVRDDPKMIACEQIVAFVLEKSRNHPLSLTMCLHDDKSLPLPRVMERLIRESARWHSVMIRMEPGSALASNFWGLTLNLPNLHSLELSSLSSHQWTEICSFVAFQNAPNAAQT
jgi:hypothetical protein